MISGSGLSNTRLINPIVFRRIFFLENGDLVLRELTLKSKVLAYLDLNPRPSSKYYQMKLYDTFMSNKDY